MFIILSLPNASSRQGYKRNMHFSLKDTLWRREPPVSQWTVNTREAQKRGRCIYALDPTISSTLLWFKGSNCEVVLILIFISYKVDNNVAISVLNVDLGYLVRD